MTTLALFVEGQTELIFAEQLLFEMLGYQHLHVVLEAQHGNIFHEIGIRGAPEEDALHRVLIANCSSDGKVLSAIKERALLLRNANYDRVLGLRDLYPLPSAELQEVYDLASEQLEGLPLPCEIVIAVREIEAWFLRDTQHLQLVNSTLTAAFILQQLGIDVEAQNVEEVQHPAGQLNQIYGLVHGSYDKSVHAAHAIAQQLNYEYLYLDAPAQVPSLKKFLDALDAGL